MLKRIQISGTVQELGPSIYHIPRFTWKALTIQTSEAISFQLNITKKKTGQKIFTLGFTQLPRRKRTEPSAILYDPNVICIPLIHISVASNLFLAHL